MNEKLGKAYNEIVAVIEPAIEKIQSVYRLWKSRYDTYAAVHPVKARLLLISGAAGTAFLAGISAFSILLFSGAFGHLPTKKELAHIEHNLASEVYSADGVLLGRYYLENRLPVELEAVSPYVVQALISTEDARFFDHHGIDFRAWLRVFFKTILMREDESGGGSTITQQLAKNLYPRKKYWLFSIPVNKAKEIVIARRLESIYDKDEILTLYLNTIPFSGNVFGIEMAAQRFFSTSAKDLKAEQAAVLIGMLKATTAYHPQKNPDRSKERRNSVLAKMEKNGFLTPGLCDSLRQTPLKLNYKIRTHDEGTATYFREFVRLELQEELKKHTKPDGSPYNLYTDGLKIYTTLDTRIQRLAEDAVSEEMKKIQEAYFRHFKKHKDALPYGSEGLLKQQLKQSDRYRHLKATGLTPEQIDSVFKVPVEMTIFDWQEKDSEKDTLLSPLDSLKYYISLLNTGFLAVEPQTGKILSWVGGINFKYNKFDHIKSRRQVGSIFKPVLYAQALEAGIPPCKHFHNEHVVYEKFDNWAPKNVNDEYGGWYNMENALKKSINTIAVQVILEIGVDPVRQLAQKMGVTSPIPKEAGIALGGVDISLYEMVNVFATIANRGARPTLHCLTRIETLDGQTIADIRPPDPKNFYRALSEQHADMMVYLLSKVVDSSSGTASRLRGKYGVKGAVAAKTGTSNDNRDGWFAGFTPNVAFGAWVGGDHQSIRFRDTGLGQGSSTALPICANFLNKLNADPTFKKWEKSKFPPLDSLALDAFDCYRDEEIDSASVDSLPVPMVEILEPDEERE
jgi:penicillin-binding protein 1A